ncbi:hypothetical protein MKW98_003788 [Papaver atlanticum]|uniref:SRP54-type proteins GTP-binding domain-containing protein n=1 Tax=Papaver atlanticum TaxID=357466 RepID=A0AAD4T816_9MAGN|nr:hypothetical protein MKW98_003788 [Papaver atlanticum]
MVEQFVIFTTGGLKDLWILLILTRNLVVLLILLNGHSTMTFGVVFVALYQKILHLLYVDDLLYMVRKEFSDIYDPKRMNYINFDDVFRQLRKEVEAKAEELKKLKQVIGRAPVALVKKQRQAAIQNGNGSSKNGGGNDSSEEHRKKMSSFTRVLSTVQEAMEDALVRILTPRCSIDVLRNVHASKEQGRPYVVTFVGVNGVGKSTNLAKIAFWLQQHNVSVMMASCDTFRLGAVEQLQTHAHRLQIPIFEKGYEKDPAVVPKEDIQEARRNGSDDNEPLLRAVSKLISLNNPDLVLFSVEALVGNDKLADLSNSPSSRVIDGISYTDLTKLNVKTIVKTLLK